MKNLVEKIVQSLVDYPEEVKITETSGESIIILEMILSPWKEFFLSPKSLSLSILSLIQTILYQ